MFKYSSYVPNYFSIPDILATEGKIRCKFSVKIQNVDMRDRGSDSDHIERGSTLDLPVWLVPSALYKTHTIVTLTLPKTFNESQRDILSAGESVVDLHKQYFYEYGIHVCKLPLREVDDVIEMLVQAFRARFRLIMDWAMHAIQDTKGARRLDQSEERIYHVGKEATMELNRWLAFGDQRLEAGKMVTTHRKQIELASISN